MGALLADIGGTYSRFAWSTGDGFSDPVCLKNRDFQSFEEVLDHFLMTQSEKPTRFVFAIASDVSGDKIFAVNLPWSISQHTLREKYKIPLDIINDFQAQGLGILSAKPEYVEQLGGGEAQAKNPICVIGPGTGLGTSLLTCESNGWKAHPSEAGHASVNADKGIYAQIIEILQKKYIDVSFERLISGSGVLNIYRALCEIQGGFMDETLTPEQIGMLARAQEKNAVFSYHVMCHFLAIFAGNLAVTMKTTGGIYLVGNILAQPLVVEELITKQFREAFESKGRFIEFMRKVPLYLCTQKNLAFEGLLNYEKSSVSG